MNFKLFIILNRCTHSVNKNILPYLREEGLTETQFLVLEYLHHKDTGKASIKELIEKTFSSGGTMTIIIKNLQKRDFISRTDNIKDKRGALISITSKGKMITQKVYSIYLKILESVLSVLKTEEKSELLTLLKILGKAER